MADINEPITFDDLVNNDRQLSSLFLTFYVYDQTSIITESSKYATLISCINGFFSARQVVVKTYLNGVQVSAYQDFQFFYVNSFVPRKAEDTIAIHLGISSSLPAGEAWGNMKNFLSTLLKPWKEFCEANIDGTPIIGYSITYKSNIRLGDKTFGSINKAALTHINPLFHYSTPTVLAQHCTENGLIFLTDVPSGKAFDSCLIYVAVEYLGKPGELVKEYIFNQSGRFNYFDVFVHKSAYQRSQLQDKNFKQFQLITDQLKADTEKLFAAVGKIGTKQPDGREISNVADRMTDLMIPYVNYKQLLLSLQIQRKNFEILYHPGKGKSDNSILDYLYYMLTQFEDGGQLILSRVEIIIDQSKSAISLIEAQQTKLSTEQTADIQVRLGILGAILALIQLLDEKSIIGILKTLFLPESTVANTLNWYVILISKTIIIGAMILCIYLFYILRKRIKPFRKQYKGTGK